jgi:F1F0 ATPase subunit 2
MINFFALPLALLIGIGLGLLYFGGLWLTVRQLPSTNNPVLLTLVSFFGRVSLCLVGFSWLMAKTGDYAPLPLVVSLIAFFWIRNTLIERLKPSARRL